MNSKDERIKKLMSEVHSLRDLLTRVNEDKEKEHKKPEKNEKKAEKKVDILKRIRERKIIDDDIPPF